MIKFTFKNAKGEEIKLNKREEMIAKALEFQNAEVLSAMGIEIPITTLTTVIKSISEQKFYQVAPADYLPVVVGEGSFGTDLLKYLSFETGGDFESGIIKTGTANAKLAQVDANVKGIRIPIVNWAKGLNWNLMEVQQAAKNGNWDLITAKEKSRKKNWDLGIQRIAFLGLSDVPEVYGLLNQPDVNSNLTVITKAISSMSTSEYINFISAIYAAYREHSGFTAEPTTFVIPENDYNGLATPINTTYPTKSKLEYLKEAFKQVSGHEVKIKKLAYANKNQSGLGVDRYALYNEDPDTLALNIPVDYTATLANSINGFNWENAAYGQFTGVKVYRTKEVLYFDF